MTPLPSQAERRARTSAAAALAPGVSSSTGGCGATGQTIAERSTATHHVKEGEIHPGRARGALGERLVVAGRDLWAVAPTSGVIAWTPPWPHALRAYQTNCFEAPNEGLG